MVFFHVLLSLLLLYNRMEKYDTMKISVKYSKRGFSFRLGLVYMYMYVSLEYIINMEHKEIIDFSFVKQ